MRIDNLNSSPRVTRAEAPAARPPATGASEPQPTDAVSLSALAAKLTAPDEDRIERLRKAVQDGSYAVDAPAIASRLIDAALRRPDGE
ncbi:MAG TPA: flagellar biosynthesis anti-sigma factor FlgM [Bryobacteraceae bacterium]|jgi:flagellar biosynthesis anti-sigma factor FlgM|nr:flagellar biosynthesis anti-sigma factor FlgM [Bryobacteraceae bacterium]